MTKNRRCLLRVWIVCTCVLAFAARAEAVIPVFIGPFQAFLALLPSILAALGAILIAAFKPATVKKLAVFLWHQKIFTVCLVLGIAGVVYGFQNDWWLPQGPVTAAEGGRDWPAFRGGPSRRGFVPGSKDPNRPYVAWNYTRERTFYSTPTVVGNRVYVSNAQLGVYGESGAILCIDAETGNEVWRYDGEGFRATFSSPSVKDGYLVSGEGLHKTRNARIVCLDLNGKLLWSYRTKSHVESSPCIDEGRVYIGAGDDGYYCLRLRPKGDKPEVLWHLSGEKYKDCETSPIVYDGVVYFGLGIGGKAIVAVDAETGEEKWRLPTPCPVFAPPTIAGGKLYVGLGNGDFVKTAEEVRNEVVQRMKQAGASPDEIAQATRDLGPRGEVWCIDLKTHEIDWKFKVQRTVLGAIAAKGDRLYFGSRDGHLYCISTSGTLRAKWNAHSEIKTSPAVANSHVYVVTSAGSLHCLTAEELEPVWEMRLGGGQLFTSSPTVARGRVFVGTPNDGLRCLGQAGPPPPPLWADGERGGRAGRSPLPEHARFDWRYPKTNRSMKLEITAPLLSLGDGVCLPCVRDGKPELLCLRTDSGEEAKRTKTPGASRRRRVRLKDEQRVKWAAAFRHPVRTAPVGMGGYLYAVDGARGQTGRALRCLDASTGKERWTLPLSAKASGRMTLDRRYLFVWTAADTITCYPVATDQQPAPLWAATLSPGSAPPVLSEDILFVATDTELTALDAATGVELWPARVPLPGKPAGSPVRVHDSIVTGTEAGVFAWRVTDGAPTWYSKVGPVSVPPVADARRLVAVTRAGELVAWDLDDLAAIFEEDEEEKANAAPKDLAPGRRIRGVHPGVPPVLASGRLVYATTKEDEEGLNVLHELDQARPRQWMDTSWLGGKLLTPVLVLNSKAYFATRKGLIVLRPSAQ